MPSVSVITSAFNRAAHARAAALGMPGARVVVLPSPLATRSADEVRQMAREGSAMRMLATGPVLGGLLAGFAVMYVTGMLVE